MKILFITYARVSLCGANARAAAMLQALADAGNHIDVVAPAVNLPPHPYVNLLVEHAGEGVCARRLRKTARLAVRQKEYDVIHAFDDAVLVARRLARRRRIPFVYDAARRFTGKAGVMPAKWWTLFPRRLQYLESRVLSRAALVFSPCTALSVDLRSLEKQAGIFQLEGIPVQSFRPRPALEEEAAPWPVAGSPGPFVFFNVLPGNEGTTQKLLLTVRKVADTLPDVHFFLHGPLHAQAQQMAERLDVAGRCVFLAADDLDSCLAALKRSDVAVWIPQKNGRYVHPEVYTLLHAGVPIVAPKDTAHEEILTEQSSIRVLTGSETMAEGIVRAIQEPLLSLAVATEARRLVSNGHTFSSFKHKVRMAYHDALHE